MNSGQCGNIFLNYELFRCKNWLIRFVFSMAIEKADTFVRVTALAPGW